MGCCSRTVLSRSPCSQNSAATDKATWNTTGRYVHVHTHTQTHRHLVICGETSSGSGGSRRCCFLTPCFAPPRVWWWPRGRRRSSSWPWRPSRRRQRFRPMSDCFDCCEEVVLTWQFPSWWFPETWSPPTSSRPRTCARGPRSSETWFFFCKNVFIYLFFIFS